MGITLTALIAATIEAAEPAADLTGFHARVMPVLREHCLHCHEREKPKGGFDLESLAPDMVGNHDVSAAWLEVLHRVSSGHMPPASVRQRPSPAETSTLLDWIGGELRKADQVAARGGRVVLRRLGRAAFLGTLRDLLGIDPVDADQLPADPVSHGFDHLAAALSTSPVHVAKYLHVVEATLERAIDERPTRPSTGLVRVDVEASPAGGAGHRLVVQHVRGDGARWSRMKGVSRPAPVRDGGWLVAQNIDLYNIAGVAQNPLGIEGLIVDEPGDYRIRVRARATQSGTWWSLPAPRLELRTWPHNQPLMSVELRGDEHRPEVHEVTVYRSAGEEIAVKVGTRNYDEFGTVWRNFKPEVAIDWIEIEGPCFEAPGWPPPSQRRILGDLPAAADEPMVRKALERFALRAWRRPPPEPEIAALLGLYRDARGGGRSQSAALRMAIAAILVSPRCLFLPEPAPGDGAPRSLDDWELAARLACFLWIGPPDEELLSAAAAGRLRLPEELARQASRMMRDARSRRFVGEFASQWLNLGRLETFAPDTDIYPEWSPALRTSMTGETTAFVGEIFAQDLDLLNLIDSGFLMLDERMAAFYGVPDVSGDHFRRVAVDAGKRRGGLLGQASILTLTSNGTRTSPVWRGVFVLERLLDDPPPPPPPNAGEIENKVPGADAVSVRERLALHRRVAACASCHARIDPLGLALEEYDGIGRWRTREFSGDPLAPTHVGSAIDPSGALPDGTSFSGADGLKRLLAGERSDQVLDCIIRKTLAFATGRAVGLGDAEAVATIRAHLRANGRRPSALIAGIVASDPFRTK